jgi:hypothetical protein
VPAIGFGAVWSLELSKSAAAQQDGKETASRHIRIRPRSLVGAVLEQPPAAVLDPTYRFCSGPGGGLHGGMQLITPTHHPLDSVPWAARLCGCGCVCAKIPCFLNSLFLVPHSMSCDEDCRLTI